jgi:hypothetical protein
MGKTSHAVRVRKTNRDERLELRLVSEEKLAFQEAADLAGVALSAWIRERLRRAAREELEGFGRTVPFLISKVQKSEPKLTQETEESTRKPNAGLQSDRG